MNLEKYIGKLFIHTEKATRKGHPNYRLYCVAKVETDPDGDPTQFLCAWKVDRHTVSRWIHPALATSEDRFILGVEMKNRDLCPVDVANNSMPTATFIPDSFYKEITLEQAMKELKPKR